MAKGRLGGALRDVQMLFGAGTAGGLTDGQLLEDVRGRGDEAGQRAFAALVERHGPAVLHACRAILRDEHAAEDAFQAVFLVLARKAGSLRVRDSLGPWLHQVACRVAANARASAARRRRARAAGRRAGRLAGPRPAGATTWARSSTRRSTGCRSATAPRSCSASWRA